MTGHSLDLDKDEDGWDFAECQCGWLSPPCPDKEIAAEFWGDHLLDATAAAHEGWPDHGRCKP